MKTSNRGAWTVTAACVGLVAGHLCWVGWQIIQTEQETERERMQWPGDSAWRVAPETTKVVVHAGDLTPELLFERVEKDAVHNGDYRIWQYMSDRWVEAHMATWEVWNAETKQTKNTKDDE